MTEARVKLAKQLALIQTSVNTAAELAQQLLRKEEDLFELHLKEVLADEHGPRRARSLYNMIKSELRKRHGYRPNEREIAAGLISLGWDKNRTQRGVSWLPPTVPAPAAPATHAAEQHQDQ